MSKTIVITDLDGTLLDEKYSFEAARPAIELLREKLVPVVVCSSKTRPEIELYRQRMGLADPFIFFAEKEISAIHGGDLFEFVRLRGVFLLWPSGGGDILRGARKPALRTSGGSSIERHEGNH